MVGWDTRYGLVMSSASERTVGLDDLVGPFQPCDSMILSWLLASINQFA